jgi:hypothetical protein
VNGDELKAAKLWEIARPLFERSSQRKQLAELDSKLSSLSHNQLQELQQISLDSLTEIHTLSEHLEQLPAADSPNSTGIEDVENICLEDTKVPVPVDS